MWITQAAMVWLFLGQTSVSSTNFGFEPHWPSLVKTGYLPNDMSYDPPKEWESMAQDAPFNVWIKKWGTLEIHKEDDPNICFPGSTECWRTSNRADYSGDLTMAYRSDASMYEVGKKYLFNVFVKPIPGQLNTETDFVELSIMVVIRNADTGISSIYKSAGASKLAPADNSWVFLSFPLSLTLEDKHKMVSSNLNVVDFFIKLQPRLDFVVDGASLEEVHCPDWEQMANNKIETLRKSSIKITNHGDCDVEIKVRNTKLGFPFGAAISGFIVGGNSDDDEDYAQRYRNYITARKKWWTWSVFYWANKWLAMERDQYEPDLKKKFKVLKDALAFLKANGICARGHPIVWNKEDALPVWAKKKSGDDFMNALMTRTTELVTHEDLQWYKHWDVSNEHVASKYFQDKINKNNVEEMLLDKVKELNGGVKRCTNQYDVLSSQQYFTEYVSSINRMKSKVDCIGIQAHLDSDEFDPEIIKRRLEVFTGMGIDVWITELTINGPCEADRAEKLRQVLTLFYSTEGVKGILMWKFVAPNPPSGAPACWPRDTALATEELENTAAGDMVDDLLGKKWCSDETLVVAANSEATLKVFDGVVDFRVDGASVDVGELGPERKAVTVIIPSDDPIVVPAP